MCHYSFSNQEIGKSKGIQNLYPFKVINQKGNPNYRGYYNPNEKKKKIGKQFIGTKYIPLGANLRPINKRQVTYDHTSNALVSSKSLSKTIKFKNFSFVIRQLNFKRCLQWS